MWCYYPLVGILYFNFSLTFFCYCSLLLKHFQMIMLCSKHDGIMYAYLFAGRHETHDLVLKRIYMDIELLHLALIRCAILCTTCETLQWALIYWLLWSVLKIINEERGFKYLCVYLLLQRFDLWCRKWIKFISFVCEVINLLPLLNRLEFARSHENCDGNIENNGMWGGNVLGE